MRSSIRLTPRDVKENFPKFFGRRVGRLSRGAQIYPPHRHGSAPRQCPWLSHLAPVRSPVRLARWILPSHPAALRIAASRCLALTGSGILILESEASKAPSDFPWRENGKTVIRSRKKWLMTHLTQPFSRRNRLVAWARGAGRAAPARSNPATPFLPLTEPLLHLTCTPTWKC